MAKQSAAKASVKSAAAKSAPAKAPAKSAAAPAKGKKTTPEAPADDATKVATFWSGLEAKKNAAAKAAPVAAPAKASKKAGAKDAPAAPAKTEAAKPKRVVVEFKPRTLPAGVSPHAIAIGARPQGGTALFAHTHAALTMLGMLDEKSKPVLKSLLMSVMGQRAVVYHLKQNNFVDGPNGISLTAPGLSKFRERQSHLDNQMANDFLSVFIDGKAPASLNIQAKEIHRV